MHTSKPERKTTRSLKPPIRSTLFGLALTALTPSSAQAEIEEPTYTVSRTLNGVELRDYAAYTVAEVLVEANADEASKRAFPILAGYIFGKNKGERKMAMTAPVTQTASPVKMAMTAPVTQTPSGEGFLVQFVLPKDITLANAPEPLDSRVMLREVAPKRVAVIRYSGFWSASNYQKHLALLQSELQTAGISWAANRCSPATTTR